MLWEWGGRTVSPHPRAHSTTTFDFTMEGKTFMHSSLMQTFFFSLHDCAEGSRTSNSRPSCCCASTDKNGVVLPHAGPPLSVHSSRGLIVPLTHRNFWVFPRRSFPCEIADAVAIESWYFSLPLRGLYVFSQWFCCPGRAVFPTFAVSCAHRYILGLLFPTRLTVLP